MEVPYSFTSEAAIEAERLALIQDFKDEQQAFLKAAVRLSEVWQELQSASKEDVGADRYPFSKSFDEMVLDIAVWTKG